MSFDIQLGHVCPHLTIGEEVALGNDRRSLNVRQPVANLESVIIRANGVLVPSSGLSAPAEVVAAFSGPYNLTKCGNQLVVSNRTQTATIKLPSGMRVTTDKMVETIRSALLNSGVGIEVSSVNGVLKFKDLSEKGTSSRIRVSGDAVTALGFEKQYQSRGKQLYPGWELVDRPDLVSLAGLTDVKRITSRYPRFLTPLKTNPVITVTYRTYQNKCLRCQSTGIENDYRLSSSGDPLLVFNEDKLNQDVLKILTTVKGSNPFHTEYGSLIPSRIGLKALPESQAIINTDAINALKVFQRIQGIQGTVQEVSPRERLARIISVNTTIANNDPTVFKVDVIASNASNQPVVITTVYAAPGTAALAGSNGLSLGLEGLGLDPRTRTLPGIALG